MKKIISITILIAMLCSTAFADAPAVLFSAFFGNDAQQEKIPYTVRTQGKDDKNTIEMKDGYMNLTSEGDGNPSVEFYFNKKVKKMVSHITAKIDEINSDVVVWLLDYDDSYGRFLVFTPQGEIKAVDGGVLKEVYKYQKNQWISIDFVIESDEYTLFIDGKQMAEKFKMPVRSNENSLIKWEKNIRGMKLDTYNKTGARTSISISELVAYEGTDILPIKELKLATQPKEEDINFEDETTEDSGVEIFANNNFNQVETDSTNIGIGGDKKKNLTYIDEFPSEENKSVKLESVCADTFNVLTSFDRALDGYFISDFRIYFDDMKSKATVTLRDPKPLFVDILTFNSGGQIRDVTNNTVATYNTNTWYRIQTIIDVKGKKYSAYLDGKQIVKDCPFDAAVSTIGIIRLHIYPPDIGGSSLHIDDWRVYGGNEFLEDEFLEKQTDVSGSSHFTNQAKMKALFAQKIAATNVGNWFFVDGKRKMYDSNNRDVRAFSEGNDLLVPLRPIIESMNGQISFNDGNVLVSYNEKELSLQENSKSYVLNGQVENAEAAVRIKNDRLYVPFSILAELFDATLLQQASGLNVLELSDKKIDTKTGSKYIAEMNRYLLYDRPSPQYIMEKLAEMYPNNEHPRIMVKQGDFERVKELSQTDEAMKGWYASLIKGANSLISADPIKYTPATGDTLLESARTMLSRAKTLGLAYNLTKDNRYKDALWRDLETVCNFPDWYPTHFLDVGEMSLAVAIGYDWLYNDWSKEQRKFLETAIETKGLNVTLHQYETDNQTGYWAVTDNNWNVVCNGGAAVAALAIGDKNPELVGKVVHYALWGLESMMKEYGPDGGWSEGITYWQYTTSYFTYLMSALNTSLGEDFGFMESPGVSNTGQFAIHGTGPKGIFNFHDAGSAFYGSPEILWMSNRLKLPELTKNNLYSRKIYNLGGGATEMIWYNPEMNVVDESVQLPTEAVFHGTEMATMRNKFGDENGLYVGLQGGVNNVNHGQLDIGTFVLDAIGERWFLQLGPDSYSLPEFFGAKRWNYYRNRAEGHNTLVINPSSGPDQVATATGKITELVSKPRGAYTVLDMTKAFSDAEDVKRGMMLGEDRGMVVVRDEIKLKKSSEIYWFAHTKAAIELGEDQKSAMLTIGNKQLYVQLNSDLDAKFTVMDAAPLGTSPQYSGQNKNSGVKKLAIHLNNAKEGYIQVAFMPMLISGEKPNLDMIPSPMPISEWNASIPEGEIVPLGADSIQIDGKEIEDFDISKAVYKSKYPFGTTDIPKVTAQSSLYDIEVTQAETMPGSAKIIVKDKENPKRTMSYLVEFAVLPNIGVVPEGAVEIKPVAVVASEVPQPENSPKNTIDGDLTTRWSAFGVQWIEYDLGASYEISNISLAWMNGQSRTYPFEIYISEDGTDYKNVLRSENSKTTDSMEIYQMPKLKARYIRIKCFGNNVNEWCSLTEAKIYANKTE